MRLWYVAGQHVFPMNWETMQPDYGNVRFGGPGWYGFTPGGAFGADEWTPLYFSTQWVNAGDSYIEQKVSTGQDLPAVGAPFGAAIDFGTISPTTGYASYLYLTNPDIVSYLNAKFGGSLANYLNALHQNKINAEISAARNAPFGVGAEVSLSPYWSPTTAEYPYAVVTGLQIGWIYDGTLPSGHALIASPEAFSTALGEIGALSDPVAAKYVEWLVRATEQAHYMDEQKQKADNAEFWSNFIKAAGIAFGPLIGVALAPVVAPIVAATGQPLVGTALTAVVKTGVTTGLQMAVAPDFDVAPTFERSTLGPEAARALAMFKLYGVEGAPTPTPIPTTYQPTRTLSWLYDPVVRESAPAVVDELERDYGLDLFDLSAPTEAGGSKLWIVGAAIGAFLLLGGKRR